jgi:hypothetical protein
MRTVTFGSRPGRVIWALIGATMLAAGYFVVAPSFRTTPEAPRPWGLWVGTDSEYRGPEADTSLTLTIDAAAGCERPAVASGEISWDSLSSFAHFAGHHPPTQISFAVAGAEVTDAQIRAGGRWEPMEVTRFRGSYLATSDLPPWRKIAGRVRFRLELAISRSSGFEACSLTSPALFEFNGFEPIWQRAQGAAGVGLRRGHERGRPPTRELRFADAVVWMTMKNWEPDRATLDAHAQVRRDRVLVTCTEVLPRPGRRFAGDPSFYERQLLEESSCGSVQRFVAPNSQSDLSLRLFLAGILVSAGVAMLLESLVSGRTREP